MNDDRHPDVILTSNGSIAIRWIRRRDEYALTAELDMSLLAARSLADRLHAAVAEQLGEAPAGFSTGELVCRLRERRRMSQSDLAKAIAGKGFLRLEIPGQPGATQFINPASMYAITPTTEAIARAVAETHQPAPVQRWELPPAITPDEDAEVRQFAGDGGPF